MRPTIVPLLMATLALVAGCSGSSGDAPDTDVAVADTDPVETDTDTDTDPVTDTMDTVADTSAPPTTPALHGETPDEAKAVPTFTEVLAMDGTARTSADLVGQPTVLWFYPRAFTGG